MKGDAVAGERRRGGLYRAQIDETEKRLIEEALMRSTGNQILAARLLGINRNTLHIKIKKLGIEVERYKG